MKPKAYIVVATVEDGSQWAYHWTKTGDKLSRSEASVYKATPYISHRTQKECVNPRGEWLRAKKIAKFIEATFPNVKKAEAFRVDSKNCPVQLIWLDRKYKYKKGMGRSFCQKYQNEHKIKFKNDNISKTS